MTIRDLVDRALDQSDMFRQKYNWWVVKRRKKPTLEWLMPLLEEALGEDYVKAAAEAEKRSHLN